MTALDDRLKKWGTLTRPEQIRYLMLAYRNNAWATPKLLMSIIDQLHTDLAKKTEQNQKMREALKTMMYEYHMCSFYDELGDYRVICPLCNGNNGHAPDCIYTMLESEE